MKSPGNSQLASNRRAMEPHSCFSDCLRHTYTSDNKRDAIFPGKLHHSHFVDISFDIHTYQTPSVMQFPLGNCITRVSLIASKIIQQGWCNSPGELHDSCFFDCLLHTYTSDNKRDAIPPGKLHQLCFFGCLRYIYTSDNTCNAIPPWELHHSCFFDCLHSPLSLSPLASGHSPLASRHRSFSCLLTLWQITTP